MPRDARKEAAPIGRDAEADAAALETLRRAAEQEAARSLAADAAEKVAGPPPMHIASPFIFASVANPPLPANNIFMHGYRQFNEEAAARLRRTKDFCLALWNELHEIDGTPTESTQFRARELQVAALRLEECALWIEKYFNV